MMCFDNTVALYVCFLSLICCSSAREEKPRIVLGGPATIENFPWICFVVCCGYHGARVVSTATLITSKHAVTSANILYENITGPLQVQDENTVKQWFQLRQHLFVHCGSTLLLPKPPSSLSSYAKYKQIRDVVNLFYPIHSGKAKPFDDDQWWAFEENVVVNPNNYSKLVRNKFGTEFALAFLEVDKEFTSTDQVQPIPLPDVVKKDTHWRAAKNLTELVNTELRRKEDDKEEKWERTCLVAGWGIETYDQLKTQSRLVYQRVSFIKDIPCNSAFCTADKDACHSGFPMPFHRTIVPPAYFCAKSLHYGDLCSMDRGAAMYCPWFLGGTVFGVLTHTGKNCGLDGLPDVFLRIDDIIRWRNVLYPPFWPPTPEPSIEPGS